MLSGFSVTRELEIEGDLEYTIALRTDENGDPIRRTFTEEVKHNWKIVKNEFKLSEYKRTLFFFVLMGLTAPNFMEWLYYF